MAVCTAKNFNFASALQSSIASASAADPMDDFAAVFGTSPLTTPETTPQHQSVPLPPLPCSPHAPVPAPLEPLPTGSVASSSDPPRKRARTEAPFTQARADRKARQRRKAREAKKAKKAREKEQSFSHHQLRDDIQERIIDPAPTVHTAMDLEEDARVTSTGYAGLNDRGRRGRKGVKLEELVGEGSKYGFTYVPWDGRTPTRLLSADGYICGVLAGVPDPRDWPRVHDEACAAMKDALKRCQPSKGEKNHRRGKFTALRCGVSHGQGNTAPANHVNNPTNAAVLEGLNKTEAFRRLAGFATSVMASWAPDLHAYYTKTLKALHDHAPRLKRNFPGSVFADSTYNLGPCTVCARHTDGQNLACGWCAITALGSFDHTKGGHLVLWDLELVIEFPPGSTILIPSAVISHSNTRIQKNEERSSFTQYTSAGLFRYVENGFRNNEDLSDEEKAAQQTKDATRWRDGLSLTPKYEEEEEDEEE